MTLSLNHCNLVRPQNEGRMKNEFTCLKSESHVHLVAVFCCHTLYSAHLDVLDICDCVRLADSKNPQSEGVRVRIMTWQMASKASCCRRLFIVGGVVHHLDVEGQNDAEVVYMLS